MVETPPQCVGKTCPAVIWLCDASQLTETSAHEVGLDELSKKKGFVLVTPEGPGGAWTILGDGRTQQSDDALFEKLLDDIPELGIDPKRVYLVGNGAGAWKAHYVAAKYGDRIAAMAEAGASIAWLDWRWTYHALPEPKRKVSVMMMHGMLDDTVTYDMKSYSLDIPSAAAWWAKRVAPGAKVETQSVADGAIKQETWKGKDAEVHLLTFKNLGHEWPGVRDEGLDVNEAVWTFLSDKTL